MRRRSVIAAMVAVGAVLTVGACSHGGGGGASTDPRAHAHVGAGVVTAAPAPSAAADGALDSNSSAGGTGVRAETVSNPLQSSAEIRRARITVAVRHSSAVSTQADAATGVVAGFGGTVDVDDRTSGRHAMATMVLRVPPTDLTAALNSLSKLGTERSRSLSTVDVTQRVADVTSRVASARDSINRLRTLYQHTTKVRDVIAVESELSSRESNLEALEAEQRTLSRLTAMATITLTLVTAVVPPPPAPPSSSHGGFLGGLEKGWHGFVTAAAWIATAVGTLLPFLVAVLVLGAAAWILRRRYPKRAPVANE